MYRKSVLLLGRHALLVAWSLGIKWIGHALGRNHKLFLDSVRHCNTLTLASNLKGHHKKESVQGNIENNLVPAAQWQETWVPLNKAEPTRQ